MHRSLLLTPFALAAVLAGCAAPSSNSNAKFTGAQADVVKTIENLESDSQPGRSKPDKVCEDLVTTALQRQLATHGSSCKNVVDTALRNADAYQLTTQKVQLNGTKATATVKVDTGKKDRVQTLELEKNPSGTDWRISRFG